MQTGILVKNQGASGAARRTGLYAPIPRLYLR
jgi:hypothetical protein